MADVDTGRGKGEGGEKTNMSVNMLWLGCCCHDRLPLLDRLKNFILAWSSLGSLTWTKRLIYTHIPLQTQVYQLVAQDRQ